MLLFRLPHALRPTAAVTLLMGCLLAFPASSVDGAPLQDNARGPAPHVNDDDALLSELARGPDGQDLFIEVFSSPESCHIKVDGRTLLYRDKSDQATNTTDIFMWKIHYNGMYAVSVNPATGLKTGEAFAPGHIPNAGYVAMEEFLTHVQPGRVLVLCALSEAAMALDQQAEALFHALNSSFAPDLQARSMFAMAAVKGGPVLAEGYSLNLDAMYPGTVGGPLRMAVRVPRAPAAAGCLRGRRAAFCARHDGYRGLCACGRPAWLRPAPRPLAHGAFFPYPVVIVASNRPRYLFRCLASLLPNRGLDPARVAVFIDGEYGEVKELLTILNVTVHEHVLELPRLGSADVGARIGAIYRYTIETAFGMFPEADKIVLLEEDLEVSPDFISFFDQTYHLLDVDPSLYCVSAWNDHGYNHTVGDVAQLYRVGFLPGLGWMLKKSLFFEEIVPAWPEPWKDFDWDVMLRLASHRKGRDCVIPDVSRTYHFGYVGKHVGASMQFKYFYDHAFNTVPDVQLKDVDKMVFHKYEALLMDALRDAVMVDGTAGDPKRCDGLLPPTATNRTYVAFIKMAGPDDVSAWEKLATCLNLWDLDVRGDHRGVWRFWFNGNPVIVVGSPYAELSSFAVHAQGEATVFGGVRTARSTKLGRWPPGLHRDMPNDRAKRYRLSAAAVSAEPPFNEDEE